MRQAKPSDPASKCSVPCQLIWSRSDPPVFAALKYPVAVRHSLESRLELVSPETGRVVKVLATSGQLVGGFTLSPGGHAVYATVAGRSRGPSIERIDAGSGNRTFIAYGYQPAPSPDGGFLAYTTGDTTLAVRDLSSGATHAISLARFLGPGGGISFAPAPAWLGDGRQIVLVPGESAEMAMGSPPRPPTMGSCLGRATPLLGARSSATCLIVVSLTAAGRPAAAHLVRIPGVPNGDVAISAIATRPRSLMVTSLGSKTIIARAVLSGTHAAVAQRLSVPPALSATPVAFDPAGRYILYLSGIHPGRQIRVFALWIAQITGGRLTHPRMLVRNFLTRPCLGDQPEGRQLRSLRRGARHVHFGF